MGLNVFLYVHFAEEVILADDENENDYDGMNLFTLCIFLRYSDGFNTVKRMCFFSLLQAPVGEPQRTIRAKLSF